MAKNTAEYSYSSMPGTGGMQGEEHNTLDMPARGAGLASYPAVVNTATFIPNANPNPPVGPHSTELNCPNCRCRIKTNVRHRTTTRTHIACLLLSWTCCCCCLPYCMDSCRNANHFCPMCQAYIGTYES